MADSRFDGNLDAPLAHGSLCAEPGCGQPAEGANHGRTGHFFNGSGAPLLSRAALAKTTPPKPSAAKVVSAGSQPVARRSESQPTASIRIEARITDEIVTALRRQKIARHLRIRRIEVLPEYSIADDAQLLAADVIVRARLLFADIPGAE